MNIPSLIAFRLDGASGRVAPYSQMTVLGAVLTGTPAGTLTLFTREDALSKIATDMRVQVHRYLAAFGLSPSSRSRVLASRNDGQLQLPGVDDASATPSWGGFR